jgi:hypothetical protein
MTEIAYYIMDLIHMNVVMSRYNKALISKKEGVFDYFSYYYLLLIQYVPWCYLVSSIKNGYIAVSYHSSECSIFIISHHPSMLFILHTVVYYRYTTIR